MSQPSQQGGQPVADGTGALIQCAECACEQADGDCAYVLYVCNDNNDSDQVYDFILNSTTIETGVDLVAQHAQPGGDVDADSNCPGRFFRTNSTIVPADLGELSSGGYLSSCCEGDDLIIKELNPSLINEGSTNTFQMQNAGQNDTATYGVVYFFRMRHDGSDWSVESVCMQSAYSDGDGLGSFTFEFLCEGTCPEPEDEDCTDCPSASFSASVDDVGGCDCVVTITQNTELCASGALALSDEWFYSVSCELVVGEESEVVSGSLGPTPTDNGDGTFTVSLCDCGDVHPGGTDCDDCGDVDCLTCFPEDLPQCVYCQCRKRTITITHRVVDENGCMGVHTEEIECGCDEPTITAELLSFGAEEDGSVSVKLAVNHDFCEQLCMAAILEDEEGVLPEPDCEFCPPEGWPTDCDFHPEQPMEVGTVTEERWNAISVENPLCLRYMLYDLTACCCFESHRVCYDGT